jgi:hypothetical protein
MSDDTAREERAREFEEHDEKRAQAFVLSKIEVADKLFLQAITSLFLGNAGPAIGTLAFVGATWKNGTLPKCWFVLWRFSFSE